MGFEKIGPYQLSGVDHIAASLALSFRLGTGSTGVFSWLITGACAICIFGGIALGVTFAPIFGILLFAWVFAAAPLIRARNAGQLTVLEYSPDGLVVECSRARTTYKWSTIRSAQTVRSRLYIKISDGCALVVPERVTDKQNLARLVQTVQSAKAA